MKTRNIQRLFEVATWIRGSDPIGAQLIQWAARRLAKDECANCQNAYSRGYAAGYKAGQKESE